MTTEKTYHMGVLTGIIVGALFLLAGFTLCILGITGTIQFFLEAGGTKARLLNASPGALFAFLGFGIVWKYKPRIEEKTEKTRRVERNNGNNGRIITNESKSTISRSEVRTGGGR